MLLERLCWSELSPPEACLITVTLASGCLAGNRHQYEEEARRADRMHMRRRLRQLWAQAQLRTRWRVLMRGKRAHTATSFPSSSADWVV